MLVNPREYVVLTSCGTTSVSSVSLVETSAYFLAGFRNFSHDREAICRGLDESGGKFGRNCLVVCFIPYIFLGHSPLIGARLCELANL